MKKLLYCAAALATLLFAGSCQRENLEPAVEGTTVTYTVKVPEAIATKAYTGGVNKLIYEVHRVEGETSVRLYQKNTTISGGVANVDIEVVKDQNFTILFWAQKEGVAFGTTDLKAVTMPTTLTANVEDYEAFYGIDQFVYATDIALTNTVELTRAVSMLNIGTTAASLNVGGETGNVTLQKSGVTVKGLPNTLNIMNDEATGVADAVYGYPTDDTVNVPADILTVGTEDYVYVAKNYVGFAAADKSTADVTLTILTDEGTITHEIPSVPFQRNYKTNIVGDLITANAKYSVTLTDTWDGEEVVEIWDGETLSQPEFTEETKTWSVNTGAELAWLAQAVNGTLPAVRSEEAPDYSKHNIVLTSNVNLGGHEWTPIGTGKKRFSGTFEGNGYAIENFTISEKHAGFPQAALFGNVAGSPTFKNVTISGAKIIYPGDGDFYGAGLVATAYGNLTIENVTVKNCEISGNNKVAGLLAHDGVVSSLKINNCHVKDCKIESLNEEDGGNVGGLVGLLQAKINHSIKNSSVKNTVINAINSTDTGKRANGEFVACAYGYDNLIVTIENCEVSDNTFTQNEDVTYESPYGVFVGGYREANGVPTVVVDGVKYLYYGLTKEGNTFKVSNAVALNKAVSLLEENDVIELLGDVTFDMNTRTHNSSTYYDGLYYIGDKSFTIDLGGKTITHDGSVNDYLLNFKNVGSKANTITIKNGTIDAGTAAYCALATSSSNAQKMTINLENINLINNNYNGAVVKFRGGAELNVKAGTVITGNNSYVGIEAVGNNTVVNVYDGAKIYQKGTSSYLGAIIGASYNATLNIYGGEGKSAKCGIIVMSTGATINVSGGEWTANGDGTVAAGNNGVLVSQNNRYESGWACKSILNVTGGTFKGGYDCWGMGPGQELDDAQINIKGGNFNANPTNYLAEDCFVQESNGIYEVYNGIAVRDVADLKAATKKEGTIYIVNDITVDTDWSYRTDGEFTKPVTIDGMGHTIKFTGKVSNPNNNNAFRFENVATVKNLTIDISETSSEKVRAISTKSAITVDNCTFIGNATARRGIIYGEGATNYDFNVVVTNSCFVNWGRGITDNENGKDVKNVVVDNNAFNNASAYISAFENITFTGNEMTNSAANITSYTAASTAKVTAIDNTLDANQYNIIGSAGKVFSIANVNAQEGFTVNAQ